MAAVVPMAAALLVLVTSCGQGSPGAAPQPKNAPPLPDITAESAPPARSDPATPTPPATLVPAPTALAVAPTPTPTPTPTTAQRPGSAGEQRPPAGAGAPPPPDRDLFELALRFRPQDDSPASRLAATSSPAAAVGEQREFFVSNLIDGTVRTVTATLKVVSEHAYWYLDDKATVPI